MATGSCKHPQAWCNPRGPFYPHRKQLRFHFPLWLSETGSVLFVKQRPTKGLRCVLQNSISHYYGNTCLTCAHTKTHTCFILINSLRVCSSFRKSFLFPTRMMGTLGQKCLTSGVHFSGIFSAKEQKKKHLLTMQYCNELNLFITLKYFTVLKEIVQSKINIYSPSTCSKAVWISFFNEHKRRYF